MDEYEVDLRDYLRVIWERKWIIVGVFVIAVAAATVYSYSLPNEYRAEALLDYQDAPYVGSTILRSSSGASPRLQLELPTADGLIAMIESARGVGAESLDGSSLIRLRSEGSASPDTLENRLQGTIDAAQGFLRDRLTERLSQRLDVLSDEIGFLRDQQATLLERIGQRESGRLEALRSQRERVVEQLDRLMSASSDQSSDGVSRQASLLALTAQLQVLQGEMARLEASSGAPQPETGSAYEQRLVELDGQLQDLELARRQYERLRDADWSPLSIAQAPQSSGAPVGPNRGLNVAIAGVLGLFVGLLLAFFVHYLQSEPIRVESSDETA